MILGDEGAECIPGTHPLQVDFRVGENQEARCRLGGAGLKEPELFWIPETGTGEKMCVFVHHAP